MFISAILVGGATQLSLSRGALAADECDGVSLRCDAARSTGERAQQPPTPVPTPTPPPTPTPTPIPTPPPVPSIDASFSIDASSPFVDSGRF